MSFTMPMTGHGAWGPYETRTLYLDPADEVVVVAGCGDRGCPQVMQEPGRVEVCREHWDGVILRWGIDSGVENAETVDVWAMGARITRGWDEEG